MKFPTLKPYFLKVKKVNGDLSKPLHPFSSVWQFADSVTLHLVPTPIGRQVARYLKYAVDLSKIGRINEAKVSALHNGRYIQFKLVWKDDSPDFERVDFPDAAGILFPLNKNAPQIVITTMGTEKEKVNVWYWRANEREQPKDVLANGLGTSETLKKSEVFSTGVWESGEWHVVMGRRMKVESKDLVQFEIGEKRLCSIAIWDGSNMERAALKSFCPCAIEINIEM